MMDAFTGYREPLLSYVVREWNRTHDANDQVVYAQLICFQKKLGPDVEERSIIRTTWATWGDKANAAGSLFDDLDQILGSEPGAPF
jgi:hypothetical protein